MTEPMKKAASLPITIQGLTKRYGGSFALDHVDLNVCSGEFLTLLGPSGSGKTTLLMAIAGFTRPDSGSLRFGDTETIRTPPHKRDLGMVFQSYALFPHMTVAANVAFSLKLRKIPQNEIRQRVENALETVQLGGYGERGITQLSGGQRQRVALARAIVFEPRILLMDEPLSALDKKLREHMQIELRRLHEKLGITTVYVTHDQREALTMSDRIAVINKGRVMQIDGPREIYERPANKFVADFIGDSTFLPVTISGGDALYGQTVLKLEAGPRNARNNLLMLRPERLQIVAGQACDDLNIFTGTVKGVIYQGDSYLLHVALAGGVEVCVRGANQRDAMVVIPQSGMAISLGLHREDTVLICDE
ncbi:putative spermidine/putrescine transport system ATP-binding protein [Paralcaligenes ureilyticus]|uniref:Spermidine/putrescine import ATP-binding protein PotA n=2 Tax=Paralcaligenes ureilyticus TaxID=627131 RepID=A0A4R3M104_9BURK|nr:ABC transporter ATP-binding protein [Paralcaligenes ureilyticus]TCT06403.1 putative spermidine/putrescine transport system ATP-binding protein [Paralcaligenes ureilyticus]